MVALLLLARSARAEGLLVHDTVDGANLDVMDLVAPGPNGKTESIAFTELGNPKPVGTYSLRLAVTGAAIRIPHCNGRGAVTVDGAVRDKGSKGPLVLLLGGETVHDVRIDVAVSPYEKRIACGERVRVGNAARTGEGLDRLVAWGDVPGDVSVRAAGQAHTAAAAQEITRLVDASTRQLAGQVMVRLLGLGRLLREGVVARADGDRVTLTVQANATEAGRVLRISSALQELGGAE